MPIGPFRHKSVSSIVNRNLNRLKGRAFAESSKLQGILSNTVGGALDQAKQLVSGGFNTGQITKKMVSKIANKSPFDMDLISPTAHLGKENSKFNYGTLVYPEETQNLGDGHYIIFDIIPSDMSKVTADAGEHKGKSFTFGKLKNKQVGEGKRRASSKEVLNARKKGLGLKPDENILRKQVGGLHGGSKHHNSISDSIVMYTPHDQQTFKYSVNYTETDMGMIKNLSDFMGSAFGGGIGGFTDALGDLASTAGRRMLETAIDAILPGFSGFNVKKTGTAFNPNTELVFEKVQMRTFSFNFQMTPRDANENDTCHSIISLFKFHMMPEDSGIGKLAVPSEFQITYMYRDKENSYIPKISRCVLKDLTVDYAPNQQFHTFKQDEKGAAPIAMKLSLEFGELEIMTKETISQGM